MNGRHRKSIRPARVTETSEYVAMIERILLGLQERIADDPAALVHARTLETALRDAVNVGIFKANAGEHGYSQNEIAAMLGATRQAVQQRIGRGRDAYAAQQERAGAGAVVKIADIRAERAETLAAAGITDRNDAERERYLRAI